MLKYVFKYTVSLQKITPNFLKPYSRYSLFFKHIWNSVRLLLNVERDELVLGGVTLLLSRIPPLRLECMTWKIVSLLDGRCLSVMSLHVKGQFPAK